MKSCVKKEEIRLRFPPFGQGFMSTPTSIISYFFHISPPPRPPATALILPCYFSWAERVEDQIIHYIVPKYPKLNKCFHVWISGSSTNPSDELLLCWNSKALLTRIFTILSQRLTRTPPPGQYVVALGGKKSRLEEVSAVEKALLHLSRGTSDPDQKPGDPRFELIDIAPYATRALAALPEEELVAPSQTD